MRIRSLHIYHFGALQEFKWTLDPSGLQFLFGENEAGKTTVMDFIKCMLFGFPTRKEAQRRYEPKNGNRLGGRVTVEHPGLGVWSVERIEGSKAAGDVKIYNDAGQQKDESFLEDLLDSIDQSLFQGVYCFGLDGLQKLDKLTAEDLGHFLLSTAITGDRDLLEIEQEFEKRQSALFKKSGKKPVLNEKLEQLRSLEKVLAELREKNESYQVLDERRENIEKKLEQISLQLRDTQRDLGAFKRLFELQPVFEKYKQLETQMHGYREKRMAFPENGIHRYEQWQKELSFLNGELSYLEDQLSKMESGEKRLATDTRLETHSREIKQLFNKLAHQELLDQKYDELKKQLAHLEKEKIELYEKTGQQWGEEELNSLSISLSSVHEQEQLIRRNESIKEKKARLEGDLEEARLKLESIEIEERELKEKLLTDEELNGLSQLENKKSAASFPFSALILPAIAGILLIWSGWSSEERIAIVFGVGILITAVLLYFLFREKAGTQPAGQLGNRKRLLEDEVYRKQHIQLTAVLSIENTAYLQLAKQIDYLELEEAKVLESTQSWAEQNGIRRNIDQLLLPGAVSSLYKLKELEKQKENVLQSLHEILEQKRSFEQKINHLALELRVPAGDNLYELITSLNDKLDEHKKNLSEKEHIEKSRQELEQRIEPLLKQTESIRQQINRLWEEAFVDNEEEYYRKGKETSVYLELVEEQKRTVNQLVSLGFPRSDLQGKAKLMTDHYQDTIETTEHLKKEEENLMKDFSLFTEEKAKCEWEMKKLLEDGSYSEHNHRYELLKEEWKATAKRWAAYRLAQHGLQVVKESYQKTKLPAVLKTSSEYFSKITEGEYQAILYTETNQMLLVKADGIRYYPHELSRGTAEQVYLSIRLAVASHSGPEGFPIFMDDIAVNFDEKRTRRTLALIQEFAHDRQILFFTCHRHLESVVPEAPLKDLQAFTLLTEK
jgi:uncharacterized protein YhaN